jgi:two-component system OmpR family response regulator
MEKVSINTRKRLILIDGEVIKPSRLQFDLLVLLSNSPGDVFTRDEILANVWKTIHVDERTVDVHVTAIRKLVGKDRIESFKGVGYAWREDELEL